MGQHPLNAATREAKHEGAVRLQARVGAGGDEGGAVSALDAIIEAVGREPYFRDESVCIYNADCRDILPLIPVGSVDLVLTDPSYNAKDIGPNQRPALA